MNQALAPDIQDLIANKNWATIRDAIADWPAPEIADLLLGLSKADRVIVFRVLPRAIAGEAFAYLNTEQQNQLLKELTDEETRQLLANLSPDDRTALLEELPGLASQKLLNLLSPKGADLHLGDGQRIVDHLAVRHLRRVDLFLAGELAVESAGLTLH